MFNDCDKHPYYIYFLTAVWLLTSSEQGPGYLILANIIFPVTKRDQPHVTFQVPIQTGSQLTGHTKAFMQANSELPHNYLLLLATADIGC